MSETPAARQLQFAARLAMQGLARAPLTTMLTILTASLSFFAIVTAWTIAANLDMALLRFNEVVRVSVFLKPGASDARGKEIASQAARNALVREARYLPPADAAERFRRQFPDIGAALDQFPDPPLLPTVEAALKPGDTDLARVQAFAAGLQKLPEVDSVDYGKDVREALDRLSAAVYRIGGALALLAAVIGLFTVASVVRLSYARRAGEMHILSVFGATPVFLRIPYFFEGMFIGAASSVLALLAAAFGSSWVFSELAVIPESLYSGFGFSFLSWGAVLTFMLVASLVSGLIAMISVRPGAGSEWIE
ncbi:MAG: hypothetical protein GMKNLPBB_01855 [Myxococcota bacterium]|nr:hypothetical protein [Myxococcota bacterium]